MFLATNHSQAIDSKHDPALADLVRLGLNNVLCHSLEDTEQMLILNPAAADLYRRAKSTILKSMAAVDSNLAVASILKSRMTDLQKLYNTNQFDLSKLSDADLCVGVYNLMFHEKQETDRDTRHRKLILVGGMISSNLPPLDLYRSRVFNQLLTSLQNGNDPTQVFKVISELFQKHSDPTLQLNAARPLRESFLDHVKTFLLSGQPFQDKCPDPISLAYYSAKTFRSICDSHNSSQVETEKTLITNDIVRPMIKQSLEKFGTLTPAVIVFLKEISQNPDMRYRILNYLQANLHEIKDYCSRTNYTEPNLMLAFRALIGNKEFKRTFEDIYVFFESTHFGPELKWLYEFRKSPNLRQYFKTTLKQGSDLEKLHALRWAPFFLEPKHFINQIKAELAVNNQFMMVHSTEVFNSLANCGKPGLSALISLANADFDKNKSVDFYKKLIDTIFLRVSNADSIYEMNKTLSYKNENLDLLSLTQAKICDPLETSKAQCQKIARACISLYISPVLNPRLQDWLSSSSLTPRLLRKLQDIYKPEDNRKDSVLAGQYLKYLRYVSSL